MVSFQIFSLFFLKIIDTNQLGLFYILAAHLIVNSNINMNPYTHDAEIFDVNGKRPLKDNAIVISELEKSTTDTLVWIYGHIDIFIHGMKATELVAYLQLVAYKYKAKNMDLVTFRTVVPFGDRLLLYSGIVEYTMWHACALAKNGLTYASLSQEVALS